MNIEELKSRLRKLKALADRSEGGGDCGAEIA